MCKASFYYLISNISFGEQSKILHNFANDSIRSKFFDKKTPAKYRKKGQSNPIMYSKLGE